MKKAKNKPETEALRVVILEDNPADAELIERELKQAGIIFVAHLVEGKINFKKALDEFRPQVILSDFKLPRFNGLAALEIARQQAPGIPFIFVSGSIGEEKAIETLTQGARDYIFKDNLARLGPAIERAIEEARLKSEKKKTDEELHSRVEELKLLANAAERFVQINTLDELYEYLSQLIQDISKADYLLLSIFDKDLQAVRPKISTGFEAFQDILQSRFSFDPLEMVFYLKDMRTDDFNDFVSRKLRPVRDGLYGLSNRKLPRPVCRAIEKLLDIDSMFSMGFSWENQLYGGLTLSFRKGNELKAHDQIEAVLNQAAVAIKRLLAEQALRENEEKFRMIADNTADTITVLDLNLTFTYVSPAIFKLRGYTVEEALQLTLQQSMPPESLAKIQKVLGEEIAREASGKANPQRSRTLELQEYHKDGSIIWVENTMSFLRDPQGKASGFLAVSKDISERKRAEATLRQSEEKYRSLVTQSPDGIFIMDLQGNFLSVNQAMCAGLKYSEEEFLSLNIRDIVPEQYITLHKERMAGILQGKAPSTAAEYEVKTKNGEIRHIAILSAPYYHNDQLVGFQGIARDITEKKKIEIRLRESEEYYRTLVETSPDAIIIIDAGGRATFASQKTLEIFGIPAKTSIIGTSIMNFVEPEDIPRVQGRMVEILSGRSLPEVREYRLLRHDHRPFWAEISSAPLRDAGGRSIALLLICRDVSERQRAEQRIRASLKEKEVLLQEIHHRVKNNLQVISGLLTLQADQSAGKSLSEIFRESQDRIRSIALIHEKLYKSHNLAEITFDEYLRSLTENLIAAHGVAAGRVAISYEMESILVTIEKAIPLGLIANELITNILKHAFPEKRQGKMRITLKERRGVKFYAPTEDTDTTPNMGTTRRTHAYELTVADNGIGLPADFSVDSQKSLGMHLVSMLAKQLQAELKVKTGPGTEFRLIFPGLPADEKEKS